MDSVLRKTGIHQLSQLQAAQNLYQVHLGHLRLTRKFQFTATTDKKSEENTIN